MKNRELDLYTEAHLLVAALRIHEHRSAQPATLEDLCRLLDFSAERGGIVLRRLADLGAVEVVQGSFGDRIFLRDHLRIEEIPRGETGKRIEEELRRFRESQRQIERKVEAIQAEQAGKKKSLFAEMERKLREELEKKGRS
ncbi:MAG: hypothetical protein WHT06_10220 [Desulfobacterales bacterium]